MTARRGSLASLDTRLPDAVRPPARPAPAPAPIPVSTPEPAPAPGPAALERKEVYLRPSQRDELARLEGALRRAKPAGQGERITVNTLIRVAVDLLLTRADALQGHTEDELRRSVGVVAWRR